MKRVLPFIIGILCFTLVNAQPSQTYRPVYDNLVPVSPSAFQFLKYTEIPVSEYTGIPSISVPIYTIKEDGVSIPIEINYHAGGIRVSQDAGWVGLGWDMNFGSVIQMINDQDDLGYLTGVINPKMLPDYYHNAIPGAFAFRWNYSQYCAGQFQGSSWTPTLPVNSPQADFGFMVATDYYVPVNGEFNTRRVELFDYPEYDSEPDVFKANFLGHSISFVKVFTNNYDSYVVLNKKGYAVDRVPISGENFNWKITVPTGEVFYFEERVVTETFSTTNDFWGNTSSGSYKASTKIWMITKIITRNKKNIQFTYTKSSAQVQLPSYSQKRYKMTTSNSTGGGSVAKTGNGLNCINCYGETYIYSKEEVVTLSSISFTKGAVSFITSNRADAYGGKKLDLINVRANDVVQSCHFNYSYFDASTVSSAGFTVADDDVNKKRLKLNSIQLKDGSVYQFIYNGTTLPRKNSFAQDYWGFYNGHLSNVSMVPNAAQFNRPDLFNNNDNHSARLEYAKAGILEKIVYPTGGSVLFEYSLHEFDNYWVPDYNTSTNTISHGGGLRVNSIVTSANNSIEVSKKTQYSYENGKAIQPRDFVRSFPYNTVEFSICGAQGTGLMQQSNYYITEVNGNGFFSTSMFGSINGIAYGKVTKTDVDNTNATIGRTETFFHNNPDRIASSVNSATHISATLPAIKHYDDNKFENGLVKEVKIFDKAGNPVKTIENLYSNWNGFSPILYGARIYGYGSLVHPQCYGNNECGTGSACYCGWGYKAQHLIGYYPIFDFQSLLSQVKTTDYENGQARLITKSISYDRYNQVQSENIIFPDYTNEITSYSRTYDATGVVRDYMMGANRLSDIWAIETQVYPPNTYPAIKKSKTTISYKMVGDKFLEEQANIFDRVDPNGIPKTITYDVYDPSNGNLREYTSNNIKTSLVWDYNQQYLIAEVKNATAADIAYTSFEADGNGGWGFGSNNITILQGGITGVKSYNLVGGIWKNDLQSTKTYRISFWVNGDKPGTNTIDVNGNPSAPLAANVFQLKATRNGWKLYEGVISNAIGIGIWPGSSSACYIDELRIHPDKAQMATFTYIPLIGVSSQSDANNRISYFEYDQANRLSIVRDQDKNIVRKICYNYAGQPEECNTFYNSIKTGSFIKSDCGPNAQGTTVTYTVPANRYSAATQPQADALAQSDVDANGQAYANQFGGCIFSSYDYSNYYYSEVCTQLGQTPEPIYISVPAGMFTSNISLQDANDQAYQYAQNYANQYGTCVSGVDLYLYNSTGNYIEIVLTNSSTYEQYYFYVSPYNYNGYPFGNVPAGTYDIYINTGYGWHSIQAGCFNYTYGNTAYFYSVQISTYCNEFSIY